MKEEAPTKKLPPKMHSGEVTLSTPTKAAHDEILTSLLRINNFDSISSIKDESLDIDLSACVSISSAGILNGNSLSSTDFWRVLDESAQNTELNLSESKEDLCNVGITGTSPLLSNLSNGNANVTGIGNNTDNQRVSEFNATFLRPEPPNAFTASPFKKSNSTTPVKQMQTEQLQHIQRSKLKLPVSTTLRLKVFKEEPQEELTYNNGQQKLEKFAHLETKIEIGETELTTPVFSMFQQPKQFINGNQSNQNVKSNEIKKQTAAQIAAQATEKEVKILNTYKCLDCNGLILNGQDDIDKHVAMNHRTRMFHRCGECEREFELLTGLKKHLKTHRTEGRKDTWKKCPDCGKCLKLGSMWMHRKIHIDNKKYVCDICGQKFVQKINLTHHVRIHSSEKPYECPECQKRFQERSHLQRHQKYHAQTRSYRCEKCGKMYKTERCLKVHNLVHLEQRPFACNVCDKSFISNSKLKQHSNIHTGMRPFKCNYCPRDFTNFPNWLKHTRRRHKVDHKTGEQLENIPSYCSKKSTTKAQKAAAEAKQQLEQQQQQQSQLNASAALGGTTTAAVAVPNKPNNEPAIQAPPNNQVKQVRRKKLPQKSNVNNSTATPAANTISINTKQQQPFPVQIRQHTTLAQQQHQQSQQLQQQKQTQSVGNKRSASNAIANAATNGSIMPPKQTKPKRERKQLTPKQLQKQPTPTQIPPLIETHIKTEPNQDVNMRPLPSEYIDLHGLSLTSAEDLIMEQALEMREECGLYETPVADIGTDNAISSETASALHFQIKNEISDEYITLKEDDYLANKKHDRLACPSLESSPFSSPASIELGGLTTPNMVAAACASNNYYLPNFSLGTPNAVFTNLTIPTNNKKIITTTITTTNSPTFVTNGTGATTSQQIMNIPLLVRSNQALPSVDTLLFSTHAGTRYYHGKTPAITKTIATHTTRQNLSS